MDEHVDVAITIGLRQRGIDVLRVQDDGFSQTADEVILDRAGALGRVVFTQDVDFLAIAAERQQNGVYFVGVIYGRQQAAPIGRIIADLEIVAQIMTPEDIVNSVQYLPL